MIPCEPRASSVLAAALLLAACGKVTSPESADGGPADHRGDGGSAGSEGAADGAPVEEEPAALEVDRAANDFGDVLEGAASAIARFTVRNTGGSATGPLATSVAGDAAEFEVVADDCAGQALGAGDACALDVRFAPAGAGSWTAGVEVGDGVAQIRVDLVGRALLPGAVILAPTSHDFGRVNTATGSTVKRFTVRNSGEVTTGALDVRLSDADALAIARDTCGGVELPGGASCVVDLRFTPDTVGSATASLTISAEPGGNAVAALGGVGVASLSVVRTGSGIGMVTSSPAGIDCGDSCAFEVDTPALSMTAEPSVGSVFAGWGSPCAGTGACEISLDADLELRARFEAIRRLTVSLAGTGQGTASFDPAGTSCGSNCRTFVNGTTVVITASPAAGSSFTSFTGCASTSGAECTVSMTQDRAVTATFTGQSYQLTAGTAGTGSGTLSLNPTGTSCGTGCSSYSYGTAVLVTASPSTGSSFASWSGCDSTSGNVCSVTMTSGRAVTATFATQRLNLTIADGIAPGTGAGASVRLSTGQTCSYYGTCGYNWASPTSVTLTRQIDPGDGECTTFIGWSGGGCSGSASTCTVSVSGTVNVTATFDRISNCIPN